MALKLEPMRWDWAPVRKGDSYPAAALTETASETTLARVVIEIKDAAGELLLTLDSDDTGVTINDSTAGAWDFEIDAIVTDDLPVGCLHYTMRITDGAGDKRTEFAGSWEILA